MSYLDDLKHDLADKAYREAYLEAVRADNDCNDQTMILAYRDVVAALEAQLAATEARECRMAATVETILSAAGMDRWLENALVVGNDVWGVSAENLRLLNLALSTVAPCPHREQACRMREALEYAAKIANDAAMVIDRLDGYDFHGSSKLALILALNHVASKAKAALAASEPCQHAGEVERLKATNHEIAGTLTEIVIERNVLRGDLAEARKLCGEAREWIKFIADAHSAKPDDFLGRLDAFAKDGEK